MVSPKIEEFVIMLQVERIEPVDVSALKKTTNTSKVYDLSNEKNDNTWILVAHKRKKYQGTSKFRLQNSTQNQVESFSTMRRHKIQHQIEVHECFITKC